jgi:ATP phosphoribosyltransferase
LQFKIRTFKRRQYSDFEDCDFNQQWNRSIKAEASNFPLEVLYLRNSDIPQYLIGVVNIAIVGDNLLVEKERDSGNSKTWVSKCKVSVAVPKHLNTIQSKT